MRSDPCPQSRTGRTASSILAVALMAAGAAAVPTMSHAATMSTLYASPIGSGTACSSSAPCSLTQAQQSVRALDGNMSGPNGGLICLCPNGNVPPCQ